LCLLPSSTSPDASVRVYGVFEPRLRRGSQAGRTRDGCMAQDFVAAGEDAVHVAVEMPGQGPGRADALEPRRGSRLGPVEARREAQGLCRGRGAVDQRLGAGRAVCEGSGDARRLRGDGNRLRSRRGTSGDDAAAPRLE
jgi:hypothetical protein